MGRMYGRGKGISASALPWKRTAPSWVKTTPEQVVELIVKLARKGLRPSQVGVQLRDLHAIPQVKAITGTKILRVMRLNKVAPALPEDLYHLIKKAIAIRKHLGKFTADSDAKFRLILVESLIHRLARFYKKTRKLDAKWGYSAQTASTLIA